MLPVGEVLKFDFGTVPIHHRSTMDQIAKDLAARRSNATYKLVQVKEFFFDEYSTEDYDG